MYRLLAIEMNQSHIQSPNPYEPAAGTTTNISHSTPKSSIGPLIGPNDMFYNNESTSPFPLFISIATTILGLVFK